MRFRFNFILICLSATLAISTGMTAQQTQAQNFHTTPSVLDRGGMQADCLRGFLERPGLPSRLPKLPLRFANGPCRSLDGAQTAGSSRDVPADNSYGTFITVDPPGDVYGTTVLEGINPRGDIVGVYFDISFTLQTFVISDGVLRIVTPHDSVPGGFLSFESPQTAINPRGDIVFNYLNGTRDYQFAFLLHNGQYTLIDPPDTDPACEGLETIPSGINAEGDIVGAYPALGSDCHGRGFLLKHGVYTNVNVPGALSTEPSAINPQGDILGNYEDSNQGTHGFLLINGTFSTFDIPGSSFDFFWGMNARGDIVGAECCLTPTAGFLLSHGKLTAIDAPGSMLTFPYGIDSQGNIVGQYVDSDGRGHGFVLVKE